MNTFEGLSSSDRLSDSELERFDEALRRRTHSTTASAYHRG